MPLYRDPEARFRPLMVPFITLAIYVGSWYTFGDKQRFASPSFKMQLSIADIQTWGCMFLAGAAFMSLTMVLRKPRWMQASLLIGGAIYLWWGTLFLFSALYDNQANPVGFGLYAFIATFHFMGSAPYLLNRLLYGKERS